MVTIEPGTLIDKYRVVQLLGDGGMGAVYYAQHAVLGRPAAVKVLHPHIARNHDLVERFVNEARIAASLNHRNIVGVLDCGTFAVSPIESQWFIALEFLQGVSVGKFIHERAGQPIDLPTILHVLGEACNGLHAAHERGLVHRDVKPENLYVTATEDDPLRIVVLDFGIAKLNQPGGGVHTHTQQVMGTPAYAAPEQLRDSKNIDRRADIFALGIIAFEMATGQRPWGATVSLYDIIAQHTAMKTPPNPRASRADLPAPWADVVARALEPDPERRWRSAKDFARALAEATPMPFSQSGMAVLEKCAPELTRAASHSLTVGRPLPAELVAAPAPITANERPASPASLSNGVPQAPRNGLPWTAPVTPQPGAAPQDASAAPVATPSTIASSSGQVVAPVAPRRRSFVPLVAGGVGLVVVGVVAIVLASGSSKGTKSSGEPAAARAASIDARPTVPAADAAPAMTALAVITEPAGASVTVAGVASGAAPVNVPVTANTTVEVRAELAGYAAATQLVPVGTTPGSIRVVLAPMVDAGVPVDAPPSRPTADKKPRGGHRGSGDKHAGSGSAAGEPGFNPDDVVN